MFNEKMSLRELILSIDAEDFSDSSNLNASEEEADLVEGIVTRAVRELQQEDIKQ